MAAPLDQGAMRRTSPHLTKGRVHVYKPMRRDEFGGAESHTRGDDTGVWQVINRMTRVQRLLRCYAVQRLHVVVGGERNRGAREHD